jgi:nitric oxide synthase-interacting protein
LLNNNFFPPLNYAVSQKKYIKRQKEKLEIMKKEAEEEKERAKEAARERVLLEFEKGQLVLTGHSSVGNTVATSGADTSEGMPFEASFHCS